MTLGLIQLVTELSTGNIFGEVKAAVHRADNLITLMYRFAVHLGASASLKPQELSRLVQGLLHLYSL
jgi:hypothetical protein